MKRAAKTAGPKLVDEDDLAEVPDLVRELEEVVNEVRDAESVETQHDLIANLEGALASLDAARKSILDLVKQAKEHR